ncbi:ogr/Delta-like zinc finger family protein [Rosenbergiella epipactidis]|uniref:ogr/Delta-like zinc finger family protein n=1 Tax=Rosenbergiella epipactidis TaxID=1544694 RepID=UPI001F4EBF0B|nr:ogr/Delta-like zinc finger family protein [Rosenbergiella epipactidis]
MMNCPLCHDAAHTRSSVKMSNDTKERYNQCQNINCGCTFKSLETVTAIITRPQLVTPVPPHPSSNGQQFLFM